MPKLQKLDNKGKPIGEPEDFPYNQAKKMVNYKSSKWRLVEKEQPKVSRDNPVTVVKDFPTNTQEQIKWIESQKEVNKLKGVKHLATSKIVSDLITKQIEVLNQNK
jgi:hypothetical protein